MSPRLRYQRRDEAPGIRKLLKTFINLSLKIPSITTSALPPDFTYHALRSVDDMPSLVQRLMYGVTGSGMPGWKDVITDEEI